MGNPVTLNPGQPLRDLTVGELTDLLTEIVRTVVQESSPDFYVNEDGVRVLYQEEEIAPDYLAELDRDFAALQEERVPLVEADDLLEELREMGVSL
jgi:hypothetical protein